jgi:hypothetical protein
MSSDGPKNSQPRVGIFWVAHAKDGAARLITAGCLLEQAEPYGDFLTYGPGHYDVWTAWRRNKTIDADHRALVRSCEYEDWPRGRIVFDRLKDRFILYADRKLMAVETIGRIHEHFHLPADRTWVEGDFHYQSRLTPNEEASSDECFWRSGRRHPFALSYTRTSGRVSVRTAPMTEPRTSPHVCLRGIICGADGRRHPCGQRAIGDAG